MKHLIGIEYDSTGFPLVNRQIHNLGKIFDTKKNQFKIGKLRKYDDGTVEFIAEHSEKVFDILSTPLTDYRKEIATFDDGNKTFYHSVSNGHQYSTCLKLGV